MAAAAWAKSYLANLKFSRWLVKGFACIHSTEGAWNDNTGNGYYGGLQMDFGFMHSYGAAYSRRWGTADNWPVWAQIDASIRAYKSGRGFWPWPNTAAACGLPLYPLSPLAIQV